MKFKEKIYQLLKFDTYGNIATASLIVCLITGVFIAIPYDVSNAYDSLNLIVMANKAGSFFRNLHYWSAQFFLVFTFLHIWEHFKKDTEKRLKKGVWLRLTISVVAVLFVMITGFILKADSEGLQARNILASLIEATPLIGNFLSYTFLGNEDSLQIIYMHHLATASIFIIIILFEHVKSVWPSARTFFITTLFVFIFSYLITPTLHDNVDPLLKGPWYFLGLQEILHWLSSPIYSIIFILFLLLALYFVRIVSTDKSKLIKKFLFFSFWIYMVLTIIGYFFRGENWEFVMPWNNPIMENSNLNLFSFAADGRESFSLDQIPIVRGKREGCLYCHSEMSGFTASHDPQALGCSSCHLGNSFSLNKDEAHKNMVLIPGNLAVSKLTCGSNDCHPKIAERVPKSIMSTNSGIVSVNKFVFKEIEKPEGLFDIKLIGHSAAESHLRNLCASCHLGNEKIEFGEITETSRGGGCKACHLNYSDEAKIQLSDYETLKSDSTLPKLHPQLSLNITNEHCFGCHSRSGRISTSYEGWHETTIDIDTLTDSDDYRIIENDRVFRFVSADVHHDAGMDCIDCHNSYEVMGDGNLYPHKEDAVKIKCIDCHLTSEAKLAGFESLDSESQKIAKLRKISKETNFLSISETGIALLNTNSDSSGFGLITKREKKELQLNPPKEVCTAAAHENLSCNACHSAWAPRCIGCHTEYDPNSISFDLLENKDISGEWLEHIGNYFAVPPTLGVTEISDSIGEKTRRIDTFIPGMVLTLDQSKFNGESEIFKRLYSPLSAHTTNKKSRTCKSCHNNPVAIGYGEGELVYKTKGRLGYWTFTPKYAEVDYNKVPEDAWIGFRSQIENLASTRSISRPFNIEEQIKILTVGACLTCHEENSEVIQNTLYDFEKTLENLSMKCILPYLE